jgi:hypothetical protein
MARDQRVGLCDKISENVESSVADCSPRHFLRPDIQKDKVRTRQSDYWSPLPNPQLWVLQQVAKSGCAWLLDCHVQERKARTRFGEVRIPIPPGSVESNFMSRLMLRGRVQTM